MTFWRKHLKFRDEISLFSCAINIFFWKIGQLKHKNIIFLAFNDAFELFDRSGGKRLVAWTECANLARCFGYNPTNQYVLHLLGGDEIDTMPKSQLAEKTIGLDDFLPHLWTISQAPDPGCYEEFFEGLKVRIKFLFKKGLKTSTKFNSIENLICLILKFLTGYDWLDRKWGHKNMVYKNMF